MLGTGELIVILCLVLLLFGGKRLPELAKSLGQGVREFKKAIQGEEDKDEEAEDTRLHKKVPKRVQIESDDTIEIKKDPEQKS